MAPVSSTSPQADGGQDESHEHQDQPDREDGEGRHVRPGFGALPSRLREGGEWIGRGRNRGRTLVIKFIHWLGSSVGGPALVDPIVLREVHLGVDLAQRDLGFDRVEL